MRPFLSVIAVIPAYLLFCLALAAADTDASAAEARKALFAARYDQAAALYTQQVATDPAQGDAWYGLVRAQLGQHHAAEAFASADQALSKAPQTSGAQTAAGLAMLRRGDLAKAEEFFRAALRIQADYPGALAGLARVDSAIALRKTARDLRLAAYRKWPDDPQLIVFHADTLQGPERIAALESALAILDATSSEARDLRARIADERAAGPRTLKRMVTPYKDAEMKLFRVIRGARPIWFFGMNVEFNQKETFRLLIDPRQSGIALSPKAAQKARLEALGNEPAEATDAVAGNKPPAKSFTFLASQVRAGDVAFADYPVTVFEGAGTGDYDGLIGPDVFRRFLVKMDYWGEKLSLTARPEGDPEASGEPIDWTAKPEPGFYRFFQFDGDVGLPVSIDGTRAKLFLLSTGLPIGTIDAETLKEYPEFAEYSRPKISGSQGMVKDTAHTNLDSLTFAGHRLNHVQVFVASLRQESDALGIGFGGLLCLPMARDLALTIDYRAGTLKIDKP